MLSPSMCYHTYDFNKHVLNNLTSIANNKVNHHSLEFEGFKKQRHGRTSWEKASNSFKYLLGNVLCSKHMIKLLNIN